MGEGSEFTVALPLLQSQELPPVKTAAEAPTADHALKVLVVDDNKDAADTVSMLLQTLGYDARLAHDGKEALRAALDYRPDVILLDIGLPGANGFQVAKWIRQEPALKDLVLITLTGYGRNPIGINRKRRGLTTTWSSRLTSRTLKTFWHQPPRLKGQMGHLQMAWRRDNKQASPSSPIYPFTQHIPQLPCTNFY